METLAPINSSTMNQSELRVEPRDKLMPAAEINTTVCPEELYTEVLDPQEKSDQDSRLKIKNEFQSWVEKIKNPNVYNAVISGFNAILHAIATATALLPQSSGIKSLNNKFNEMAFFCTRYIAPFFSFTISAATALWNKKPVEALIKIIPPVFLPLVGDSNIDIVYGSCFGMNQPYDLALKRIEAKSDQNLSFANHVKESNQSFSGNIKLVTGIFKEMFNDIAKGKMPLRESWFFMNCTLNLLGSFPLLLFDRHSRDSSMAKILGLVRNIGGIMGDIGFVLFDRNNPYKLLVSALCGSSAVASIAKRWVSERSSRTLIHLSAALDVAAYAAWNAFNSNQHKKQAQAPKSIPVKLDLHSNKAPHSSNLAHTAA